MKRTSSKFPLLIYKRYHQIHRRLSLTLLVFGIVMVGLGIVLPYLKLPLGARDTRTIMLVGLVLIAFGFARYMLTLAFSRMAYVECTPRVVKIQTPLMPIVFSYSRIQETRPCDLRDIFPPEKQKGMRKKTLEGLWGQTVIVVDMKSLPMGRPAVRALSGPLLLLPKVPGFIFLVEDWMGLSQQIADGLDSWRRRTTQKATR